LAFFDHLYVSVKIRALFSGQGKDSGQFWTPQKTAFLQGFLQKISKSTQKQNAPNRILERFFAGLAAWLWPTACENLQQKS
jgi:hypothetical protein